MVLSYFYIRYFILFTVSKLVSNVGIGLLHYYLGPGIVNFVLILKSK